MNAVPPCTSANAGRTHQGSRVATGKTQLQFEVLLPHSRGYPIAAEGTPLTAQHSWDRMKLKLANHVIICCAFFSMTLGAIND